jgi:Asp-tRNA(Asn)/Glu-tRNA(Gln) amidotransferase A subunit family amidase
VLPSVLGYQRSTWGGNPGNPYDTTRSASLGSSSGSGVSVSANLVMASLGEETRASCRGPANHNAVALILPHKSMLGFNGGAIGADIYCDRSGILCRTIADCAKVLDALKDPVEGYYDPRDPYTTVPRSSVAEHAVREPRPDARDARRAHGHPPRHRAGVHGVPAGLEDRGADRHRRREGDQDDPRRQAAGDARGVI